MDKGHTAASMWEGEPSSSQRGRKLLQTVERFGATGQDAAFGLF